MFSPLTAFELVWTMCWFLYSHMGLRFVFCRSTFIVLLYLYTVNINEPVSYILRLNCFGVGIVLWLRFAQKMSALDVRLRLIDRVDISALVKIFTCYFYQ